MQKSEIWRCKKSAFNKQSYLKSHQPVIIFSTMVFTKKANYVAVELRIKNFLKASGTISEEDFYLVYAKVGNLEV